MSDDIIIIKGAVIRYPSVYKPRKPFVSGAPERYGTGFSYEGDELEKVGVNRGGKEKLYNCNSLYPPLITLASGSYEDMAKAVQIADCRNMCRDALLANAGATLHLKTFKYDNEYGRGVGIALLELEVYASHMLSLALGENP